MGAMGMAACRAMGLGPTIQRCSQESEAEAAAIRAAFVQHGEMSAAIELRRLFPGITDNAQARECARTIAGWQPLPVKPVRRLYQGKGRAP
jgi:hypothetical protein